MTTEQVPAIILMAVPIPLFLVLLLFFKKNRPLGAVGRAADLTTISLFFAVPLSVKMIWGVSAFAPVATLAVLAAIVFLFSEWRGTKEIDVAVYARKTWRFYFLTLSLAYVLVWLFGLSLTLYRTL